MIVLIIVLSVFCGFLLGMICQREYFQRNRIFHKLLDQHLDTINR